MCLSGLGLPADCEPLSACIDIVATGGSLPVTFVLVSFFADYSASFDRDEIVEPRPGTGDPCWSSYVSIREDDENSADQSPMSSG